MEIQQDTNDIKLAVTIVPSIFLLYQLDWLNDRSQIKIWRKSRRIGATYVQAYEDVLDALTLKIRGKVVDVWFSSADITAAKEYIMYCAHWARVFNIAVEDLGEIVIDEEKGVKALSIEFTNGARINALSSNPTQFRSKGGKIVLDEFAHHKDQQKLWTAAGASALVWGYPVRILSTDNGVSCKFYRFVNAILDGKSGWSLHKTTIYDAVGQGLADKVLGRELTDEERLKWIQTLKENAGDELTWKQEYCCEPIDEAAAFLPYSLLEGCYAETYCPINETTSDLYIGFDVARKKHLSVISVLEKYLGVLYLRKLIPLRNVTFSRQKKILYALLDNKRVRRVCIDSTGIGMQLAEEAQEKYGRTKVEAILFTARSKEEMAMNLRNAIEDRAIRFPDEEAITNDLHSVKRIVTATGSIRFDVESDETDGHGDRFWSFALGVHAAKAKPKSKAEVRSACPRNNIVNGHFDYAPFKRGTRGDYF